MITAAPWLGCPICKTMMSNEETPMEMGNKQRTPATLEYFITLRNILGNIEDIANRIHTLHLYTTYQQKVTTTTEPGEYEKFCFSSHQPAAAGRAG